MSLLTTTSQAAPTSIYDFTVESIDQSHSALSQYKGKALLIVNTASGCGYTPQYKGLQALDSRYSEKGLVVLGFPSNDFGGQEPGSNGEIKKFCELNYKVRFPLFAKGPVVGPSAQPLFRWLTGDANPKLKGPISWNFEKFLIDRQGKLIQRYRSSVEPEDPSIVQAIEAALK